MKVSIHTASVEMKRRGGDKIAIKLRLPVKDGFVVHDDFPCTLTITGDGRIYCVTPTDGDMVYDREYHIQADKNGNFEIVYDKPRGGQLRLGGKA